MAIANRSRVTPWGAAIAGIPEPAKTRSNTCLYGIVNHAAGMLAGIEPGGTRASGAEPFSLVSKSPEPQSRAWCPISMSLLGGPTDWFSRADQPGNSTGPPFQLKTGPMLEFHSRLLNM